MYEDFSEKTPLKIMKKTLLKVGEYFVQKYLVHMNISKD